MNPHPLKIVICVFLLHVVTHLLTNLQNRGLCGQKNFPTRNKVFLRKVHDAILQLITLWPPAEKLKWAFFITSLMNCTEALMINQDIVAAPFFRLYWLIIPHSHRSQLQTYRMNMNMLDGSVNFTSLKEMTACATFVFVVQHWKWNIKVTKGKQCAIDSKNPTRRIH